MVDSENESFDSDAVIKDKIIDQGGQSKVYIGTYYDKIVVVKEYDKEFEYEMREIKAYSKLSHKAMVKFYGYYFDNRQRLNLVLDYAEGETLEKLIVQEKINFNQKLNLIYQLCDFLIYLKLNKTIHRDLKPNNFKVKILSESEVSLKIIDFGIAKINSQTQSKASNDFSTLSFAPPEIFTIDEEDKFKISYKYDVWSFGLIVSYLMTGISPWCNTSKDILRISKIEQMLIEKKKFNIPKTLDEKLKIIVQECTLIEPEERADPVNIKILIEKIMESINMQT